MLGVRVSKGRKDAEGKERGQGKDYKELVRGLVM